MPIDEKIRKRWEAKEESYALYRDRMLRDARIDLDQAPPVGTLVKIITNRSRKAQAGEQGTIFWKGISDFNFKAVVGIKITEERKVYLDVTAIKKIT